MNNEWFFEKFALIADAPGAVDRMRGLVLELAVKGRLSRQASGNNSSKVRLDSLGEWAQGCGFPISEQGHKDREILFAKVSDMNLPENTRELTITSNTIDIETVRRLRIKVHPPGTVIFPKIGGAIATNKRRILVKPTAIDNNCSGIIPSKSCDTTWLFIVLSAIDFSKYQSGTSVPSVNQSTLGEIEVFLPPLAEQKRIVAKVEELMGLCDKLESQQQERELRKSVLVRSSLSRFAESPTRENLGYLFHNSYDIPPSELRKSILTLAVQGKLVPFDIESTKQTVGEHIDFQNGFAFKSQWFTTTGTRLCRNVNVSHGFLDWKETVFVDEKIVGDFQRFALCEGDIVLSLDRPLIATGLKVARVTQEDLPSLLLQRVARLTPKHDQLTQSYIFLWLNSTAFVDCIAPGRSNGVPHISTRQVQELSFSLPPLSEQHRIVSKVDQLMSLVDELERQQATSREKASNLLDAIVHEMTSGG